MTDVDRYITDEAVEAVLAVYRFRKTQQSAVADILRAALPGVLARHRADVLREAASQMLDPYIGCADDACRTLRAMAQQAVTK
jgi:hypothetical protein